jgi:hypothetical protein
VQEPPIESPANAPSACFSADCQLMQYHIRLTALDLVFIKYDFDLPIIRDKIRPPMRHDK